MAGQNGRLAAFWSYQRRSHGGSTLKAACCLVIFGITPSESGDAMIDLNYNLGALVDLN